MKVLVLNGSPKGEYSITFQTVLYLEKKFSEHHFRFLHVGRRIKSLEKDFSEAAEAIKEADLLLFSYPVYTFIAPSQLHRFMELLKDSGLDLSRKFVTQVTTSKHFYDVTAHKYIQENCGDLGMKYINGLSADMDDLLTENGRKTAKAFFEYVSWCVKNDIYETIPKSSVKPAHIKVTPSSPTPGKKKKDVVIVTDRPDWQLQDMIDRFQAVLPYESRVTDISSYPIKGDV